MPFKSQAQVQKFKDLVKAGKMPQATYDEWAKATPNLEFLPERIRKK